MNIYARITDDTLAGQNDPDVTSITFNLFDELNGVDAFINLRLRQNQAHLAIDAIHDFARKLMDLEKRKRTRTSFFNCLRAKPLDACVLGKFLPEANPSSYDDMQTYFKVCERDNPTLIVKVTDGKYILVHTTPAPITVPEDATEYVVFGKRTTPHQTYLKVKETFTKASPEYLSKRYLEFCEIAVSGEKTDIKHVFITA